MYVGLWVVFEQLQIIIVKLLVSTFRRSEWKYWSLLLLLLLLLSL